jgi:hypothetical protein
VRCCIVCLKEEHNHEAREEHEEGKEGKAIRCLGAAFVCFAPFVFS